MSLPTMPKIEVVHYPRGEKRVLIDGVAIGGGVEGVDAAAEFDRFYKVTIRLHTDSVIYRDATREEVEGDNT